MVEKDTTDITLWPPHTPTCAHTYMSIHSHTHTKSWEYNSVVKWEAYQLQRSVFDPQNRTNTHTHTKITLQIQVCDVAPFAVSLSSIYKALDLTPFPHKPAVGIHICKSQYSRGEGRNISTSKSSLAT